MSASRKITDSSSFSSSSQNHPNIMINEFMASNTTIDIPGYSQNDDWIELYNPTNSSIDISGYYITDDINSPTKFRLPSSAGSLVIPAKGYVVLICSDNPGLGKNHITLGLSVSGEEIGVYSPDGSTLVDYVQFDAQRSDDLHIQNN